MNIKSMSPAFEQTKMGDTLLINGKQCVRLTKELYKRLVALDLRPYYVSGAYMWPVSDWHEVTTEETVANQVWEDNAGSFVIPAGLVEWLTGNSE